VIVTILAIIAGAIIYAFLWLIALNGANWLEPLLAVPVILVVLIAGGSWLTRYLGLTPRSPKFHDRDDGES
jgi:hypothetical protein